MHAARRGGPTPWQRPAPLVLTLTRIAAYGPRNTRSLSTHSSVYRHFGRRGLPQSL